MAMTRRALMKSLVLLTVVVFGSGHTPYAQWNIYRKRHLLILTLKGDGSYPVGKQLAKVLAEALPASHARVARAPSTDRVASLLSSAQLDVALLEYAYAAALAEGTRPFEEFGPVSLRLLVGVGEFVLICRDDFPEEHAFLVTKALVESGERIPFGLKPRLDGPQGEPTSLPTHPGARAYFEGRVVRDTTVRTQANDNPQPHVQHGPPIE